MSADLISEIVKPRNPGLDSVIIEDNEFYQRATFKGAAMLRIHEEAELAGESFISSVHCWGYRYRKVGDSKVNS